MKGSIFSGVTGRVWKKVDAGARRVPVGVALERGLLLLRLVPGGHSIPAAQSMAPAGLLFWAVLEGRALSSV